MNPNPFKPTAGKRPPILIGRESVIEDFEEGLDNGAGAPGRLMLITGNRGCGKTVLLRELQRLASERGWAVVSDFASLGLCDRLADALRSNKPVVTSMEFGPSFGRMSVEAARAKGETLRGLVNERLKRLGPGKGILFAIDEAQSASIEELAALAVLYQQVLGDQDATGLSDSDQRGLALVFAGLPSMVDDLLEEPSVTFLRRAQQRTLGAISLPKVRDSYIQTVKNAGLYVDAGTADLAAHKSMGHPYMVQLVGYYMWRSAVRRGSQVIERHDVEDGHADAVSSVSVVVVAVEGVEIFPVPHLVVLFQHILVVGIASRGDNDTVFCAHGVRVAVCTAANDASYAIAFGDELGCRRGEQDAKIESFHLSFEHVEIAFSIHVF